jgi:hypothetical protein
VPALNENVTSKTEVGFSTKHTKGQKCIYKYHILYCCLHPFCSVQ